MPDDRQYCTFRLAEHDFGVDVLLVQEVIRAHTLTRVPLAPAVVGGLMNLRGQIVTVLDMRLRFGLPARPDDREAVHVVVRTDDGPVGLRVDDVGDVLQVGAESFEPLPQTLQGLPRELLCGVYKLDAQLLLILDVSRAVTLTSAYAT